LVPWRRASPSSEPVRAGRLTWTTNEFANREVERVVDQVIVETGTDPFTSENEHNGYASSDGVGGFVGQADWCLRDVRVQRLVAVDDFDRV
jgi:hypothetical protein